MKTHFFGALCALVLTFVISTSTNAAPVSGQGTWETTLQGRDLDGNLSTFEAYYDTALNITWLADANAGAWSEYAEPLLGGKMSWFSANGWAASLNFNGITGWRLPTMIDASEFGCAEIIYSGANCGYNVDPTTSEMAHMFHVTLGDKSLFDASGNFGQPGWDPTYGNTGPFNNIQGFFPSLQGPSQYWSATPSDNPGGAWFFDFYIGYQNIDSLEGGYWFAWAVHSGDVGASTVPVPAAMWLFGSGLIGLLGVSRKRRR